MRERALRRHVEVPVQHPRRIPSPCRRGSAPRSSSRRRAQRPRCPTRRPHRRRPVQSLLRTAYTCVQPVTMPRTGELSNRTHGSGGVEAVEGEFAVEVNLLEPWHTAAQCRRSQCAYVRSVSATRYRFYKTVSCSVRSPPSKKPMRR